MSNKHVNEIPADETATVAGITAKKVFVFDNDGNQITSFGGPGAGNATLTIRGNVTVAMPGGATVYQGTDPWTTSLKGNVTLSDSKGYIGLVSIAPLPTGVNYVGLASVNIGGGNVGINGNVTLADSKGYIGLVSVGGGQIGVLGNVTLSDSKGYIGLVSVSHAAWADPKTYIGLVTVTPASNVTLNASAAQIGFVTISEALPYSSPSVVIGMVSSASGGLVQFPNSAIKWVSVRAAYGNVTTVYVGGSNATINNGFPLLPGDSVGMAISNTNQLYLVGVGTSECRFLGGN